ncbi:putative quinol monooxygenase [Halobellus sp. EA9]|uniref:putative quinol monooxygenase n=1 Tax=Halobellus sp. EA9 TaxID=3421647 RepID=UPI003EBB360B
MIVKHSEVPVEPETREEAIELLEALAADSRAEEGVIKYRVTADLEDPNTIRIFEQYRDQAAADAHEESDHLAAFERAFEPHLAGRSTLHSFDVRSKTTTDGP